MTIQSVLKEIFTKLNESINSTLSMTAITRNAEGKPYKCRPGFVFCHSPGKAQKSKFTRRAGSVCPEKAPKKGAREGSTGNGIVKPQKRFSGNTYFGNIRAFPR